MKQRGRTALSIVQKYYPSVTKVRDAKTTIGIAVTSADCKRSTPKSPDDCAMANAFCRQFDGAVISLKRAYLIKGDKAVRYDVPASVSREIISFDRNHDFAPGDYWLNPPSKWGALGVNGRLRGQADKRKVHANNGARKHHKTAGIRAL